MCFQNAKKENGNRTEFILTDDLRFKRASDRMDPFLLYNAALKVLLDEKSIHYRISDSSVITEEKQMVSDEAVKTVDVNIDEPKSTETELLQEVD